MLLQPGTMYTSYGGSLRARAAILRLVLLFPVAFAVRCSNRIPSLHCPCCIRAASALLIKRGHETGLQKGPDGSRWANLVAASQGSSWMATAFSSSRISPDVPINWEIWGICGDETTTTGGPPLESFWVP